MASRVLFAARRRAPDPLFGLGSVFLSILLGLSDGGPFRPLRRRFSSRNAATSARSAAFLVGPRCMVQYEC